MYSIEVRHSRFPNKILDPNLGGFFPRYHGWKHFDAPKDYVGRDEKAFVAVKKNEVVILGESGIIVRIRKPMQRRLHEDFIGYLAYQSTKYRRGQFDTYDGEMGEFTSETMPKETVSNAIALKDAFCRELVKDRTKAFLSDRKRWWRLLRYVRIVSEPLRLLDKYEIAEPDEKRRKVLDLGEEHYKEACGALKDLAEGATGILGFVLARF